MKKEHLKYLRCPKTKKPLKLRIDIIVGDRVKEGSLIEPVSGNNYPIINFIPRFVQLNNYTNNFGLQWNIHCSTQHDNSSGFNISKDRFEKETMWGKSCPNEIILEAGCGSGRFTQHALSTGALVISFDFSSAVEANYQINGEHENLLIVQASIYEMPFDSHFFHKVFCFGVLQHTPSPRDSFTCIVNAIKPGGKISSDIYRKDFASLFLTPKYLVRTFTKKMKPE
ncbi:MAG: methyltransferase domain-containing protein, partial [Melioribacteraceae bacterium]|nr:methyltransferase domain-containing protein [Melioribacteraceae bacterium]